MTCHPLRRQVFLYTYHRHVIAVSHPRRLRLMPGQSRKVLAAGQAMPLFSSPTMLELIFEVEYATADDLRYIQRMVTALVEECLSKEVPNE